jgi:hypothetical protein
MCVAGAISTLSIIAWPGAPPTQPAPAGRETRSPSAPVGVLELRLLQLRLGERQLARADARVQVVLDPVDGRRPWIRLRPEVARIRRIAAELETDQVVLLVCGRRAVLVVHPHLLALERVRVVDGRTDRARPAALADRRADRRLRHRGIQHARRADGIGDDRRRGHMRAQVHEQRERCNCDRRREQQAAFRSHRERRG